MELKARVRHIAKVLHHFLPTDFPSAAKLIISISHALQKENFPQHQFENIFLAEYVEQFGRGFPEIVAAVRKELAKTIGAEYASEHLLISDQINVNPRS